MLLKIIEKSFNITFGNIRLMIIRLISFNSFKYKLRNMISFDTHIYTSNKGKIKLGKWVRTTRNVTLSASNGGILTMGNGSGANNNCQIVAHKRIQIGDDVFIGPNTTIVDHNHIFDKDGVRRREFKCDDVIIGNNVWIGANCVILKGTVIGDKSVIGAGSVISGTYPKNSFIIQKRDTEVRKIR